MGTLYLAASIGCTLLVTIAFKLFDKYGLNTIQAIAFNYALCAGLGLAVARNREVIRTIENGASWIPFAVGIGLLFFVAFYLTALVTQKISVTVSGVASKMSLVIPVVASLFVFETATKTYDWINYLGIGMSFVAIYLISKKGDSASPSQASRWLWLLPAFVFFGSGLVDSMINYTSLTYLEDDQTEVFTIYLFGAAAVGGLGFSAYRAWRHGERWHYCNLLGGVALGLPNYFAMFSILRALEAFDNDGALIYPMANLGVIMLSAVAAVLLFRERLTSVNRIGLGLAVLALLLLAYQELVEATGLEGIS